MSPRNLSLVTVAALVATGSTEPMVGHLSRAQTNGLTQDDLKELIIHLAFYAGCRAPWDLNAGDQKSVDSIIGTR